MAQPGHRVKEGQRNKRGNNEGGGQGGREGSWGKKICLQRRRIFLSGTNLKHLSLLSCATSSDNGLSNRDSSWDLTSSGKHLNLDALSLSVKCRLCSNKMRMTVSGQRPTCHDISISGATKWKVCANCTRQLTHSYRYGTALRAVQ